jgi:hypothetical protein
VNKDAEQPVRFRVFDIQGRLVTEGQGQGGDMLLHQFPPDGPAVHFVQIDHPKHPQTFKIFVP